jgi:Transglycosylase SLT domain
MMALSSLRIEATLDGSGYAQGGAQVTNTNKAMIASGDGFAASQAAVQGSVTQTERVLTTHATAVERVKSKYIDGYAATAQYGKAVSDLNRFLDTGKISQGDYEKAMAGVVARYGPMIQGGAAAAGTISTLATAARATGQDIEALATSHDHATGSASRMREGMVLVHEMLSGNYRRAVGSATIELQNFGLMQSILRTAMNPFVVSTVAVAAAFGFLVERAAAAQAQIRGFDVLLRGVGATSLGTAAQLGASARSLRDVGLTPQEGSTEITAAIRAGINPGRAEQVVRTGANLAPALGDNATKQLTSALTGGVESAIKFAQSINAIDSTAVAGYRDMARAGQSLQAIDDIFAKISTQADGLHRASLSPLGQKMEDLRVTTGHFLDTLAKSAVIQGSVDLLDKLIGGLDHLAAIQLPEWLLVLATGGAAAPLAAGGALKSLTSGTGPIFDPNTGLQIGGAPIGSAAVASAAIPPAGSAGAQLQDLVARIIQVESGGNPGLTSSAGARGLMQLMPGTASGLGVTNPFDPGQNVAGGSRYIQGLITKYGDVSTALMAYNWGPANVDAYLAGKKYLPSSVSDYATSVLSATPNAASRQYAQGAVSLSGQEAGSVLRPDTAANDSASTVDQIIAQRTREVEIMNKVGLAYDQAKAKQDAQTTAAEKGLTTSEQQRLEQGLVALSTQAVIAQRDKALRAGEVEINTNQDIAKAYSESTAAGMKAESAAQAERETFQQLDSTTSNLAQQFISLRTSQLEAAKAAQTMIEVQKSINQRSDQAQVIQLQTRLTGQDATPEQIAAATATLQEQQKLRNLGVSLSSDTAKNDLASLDALNKQTQALSDADRGRQRLDDGIKSVASTVDNTLTTAIQNAFSGSTITNWAQLARQALGQIVSQLSSSLFIKPLEGTILQALGASPTGDTFGELGSIKL